MSIQEKQTYALNQTFDLIKECFIYAAEKEAIDNAFNNALKFIDNNCPWPSHSLSKASVIRILDTIPLSIEYHSLAVFVSAMTFCEYRAKEDSFLDIKGRYEAICNTVKAIKQGTI